jgi:hypothetical protein
VYHSDLTMRMNILSRAVLDSLNAGTCADQGVARLFERVARISWIREMVLALEDPSCALAVIVKSGEAKCSILARAIPGKSGITVRGFRGAVEHDLLISGGAMLSEQGVYLVLCVMKAAPSAAESRRNSLNPAFKVKSRSRKTACSAA